MGNDSARASALIALVTALAIALPAAASQDSGGVSPERPPLQESGGVAGPAVEDGARSSQAPAPAPATSAPSTGAGGGGGGGSGRDLPTTGLEIGALTAVGLGLLLAGVALRRRQTA